MGKAKLVRAKARGDQVQDLCSVALDKLFASPINNVGKPVADALQRILHHPLVIRILQDGEELSCSKLADLTLRRRCCQLGSRDKGCLLDWCCRKTWLALAESNQAAEKVWVDLVSEEVEGGDVVVVDHVLAVVRVLPVQLLANPIQQLLELGQRGVGGVNINPVLDHLFTELTLDILSTLKLGSRNIIKSLRADSSQVTDALLPRFRGDEGVELVGTFHNGDPASVRETAEVATELKQTILHLTLSLSHKLGLGGIRPLLADQTIASSVPVRSLSLQQLVDPGRVAETGHSADRIRVHLAGQSLHQLRDELLHESLALLGDEPDRDEVARAVEHLPQLLLGLVGHQGVPCLTNHLFADLAHLIVVLWDGLLLPHRLDAVLHCRTLTRLGNVGAPVGRSPGAFVAARGC